MGVTQANRDLFIYGSLEDDMELLQQQAEEDEEQTAEDGKLGRKNANRNRMRSKTCQFLDSPVMTGRKNGARQARRMENLRQLLTLAENDELGELEFDCICEPSVSAFTRLFNEREKMKIWNDFVNSSEEDQDLVLQRAGQSGMSESTGALDGHVCLSDKLDDSWEEIPDKRAAHPAYSAEASYRKIDRKLKDLLKKRHLPMGILENLEEEIVSFFKEWPRSVFVSKLASSYERMLIHAVCQFLDLRSQSFEENGERRTQIENKKSTFLPPSPLLTEYLQRQSSN